MGNRSTALLITELVPDAVVWPSRGRTGCLREEIIFSLLGWLLITMMILGDRDT